MKKIYSLILIFFASITWGQVNIASSLTACYSLNNNGTEPINALTGTLSSVTGTVDRFSNANSALAFSGGTSSYVELPNSPLLKANAVSVSGWFKTNLSSSQILVFAHNGCTSFHEGYQIALSNTGGATFRLQAAKSASNCIGAMQAACNGTTTTLQANVWYHVGAYFGSDSLKIYVNGILNGAMSATLPINYAAPAKVYLGGTNLLSFNLPFNGSADNFRFYNRKLNGAEFNSLYVNDQTCLTGFVPVANYSLTPTISPNNVCINAPINFTDLSTNTPTAWAWQFPGATPSVSTLSNPVITFSATGFHTVSLISTNAYGASTAYTGTVFASGCLGLNEASDGNKLLLMPNPSSGIVQVQLEEAIKEVVVIDINGKELIRRIGNFGTKAEIDISEFPKGIYFLQVKASNRIYQEKIIRE